MSKKSKKNQSVSNKQEGVTVKGIVVEALPNAFFRVKLENDCIVLARICGKMAQKFIRVLPDDIVDVEVCPYDLTRGRITYRYK